MVWIFTRRQEEDVGTYIPHVPRAPSGVRRFWFPAELDPKTGSDHEIFLILIRSNGHQVCA